MIARPDLPIGVFDSGVGGLTVMRALQHHLPKERILYFGDTARVPYGVKSAETIRQYSLQIVDFLVAQEVKLLIVACNTMAAVAAEAIRARSPVPVLDVIEAGAQAASRATRSGRIGVIGTLTTIGSGAYESSMRRHRNHPRIISQACPMFVPLVEEGWLDHPVTRLTAQEYLAPLLAEEIDTLVLGCTHYPLLQPVLQQTAGPGVTLVDSAETTALQTRALLDRLELHNSGESQPVHRVCVTDVPQRFRAVGERFLGTTLPEIELLQW